MQIESPIAIFQDRTKPLFHRGERTVSGDSSEILRWIAKDFAYLRRKQLTVGLRNFGKVITRNKNN